MTGAGPGVAEALARLGDELPVVSTRVERQQQDAVGAGAADLAVRLHDGEARLALAARAGDELADAVGRVGSSGRRLRREPLVLVIVAVGPAGGVKVRERPPVRAGRTATFC